MILTNIIKGFTSLINYLLDLLPNVPQMPTSITTAVNSVLDFIFTHIKLLEVFIPLDLIAILLPLSLIVVNLNRIWGIIRLVYRLIPIFGKN